MDSSGKPTHYVALKEDITQRKRTDQALLQQRARLQQLLDTAPVGVAISVDGEIRFANPRIGEMVNLKEGTIASSSYVHPEERDRIIKLLQKEGIARDVELQMYGPKGEIQDILATFFATDYEGKPGILGWLIECAKAQGSGGGNPSSQGIGRRDDQGEKRLPGQYEP